MRIAQDIPDGSVLVDCVTRVTSRAVAQRLKDDGVDGVIQYIGRMSMADPGCLPEHVDAILSVGLGCFGVCYADDFSGARRATDYRAAGFIESVTLATDLESYHLPAAQCIVSLNAAARDVQAAAFGPALYNGAGHPLDGPQLGELVFPVYWRSLSRSVPMPVWQGAETGYGLVQEFGDPRDPSADWRAVYRGGVHVDINTAQADNRGRRLRWMIDDAA